MKVIPTAKVVEVDNEGLVSLLGKPIEVWCMNYIYVGLLEGVNETCIKLSQAHVVYETGPFGTKTYKDVQKHSSDVVYVQIGAMESFAAARENSPIKV